MTGQYAVKIVGALDRALVTVADDEKMHGGAPARTYPASSLFRMSEEAKTFHPRGNSNGFDWREEGVVGVIYLTILREGLQSLDRPTARLDVRRCVRPRQAFR